MAILSVASLYKAKSQFVNIYKITCWDLEWDAIESAGQVSANGHLNNKNETSLHLFSFSWILSEFYSVPNIAFLYILLDLFS